jgi:hypothetical protein
MPLLKKGQQQCRRQKQKRHGGAPSVEQGRHSHAQELVARERADHRPETRTDGWRNIPAGGQAERASRDGEAERQEDGPESGAESGQQTITATRYTMAVAAGLPVIDAKSAPSGPAIIAPPRSPPPTPTIVRLITWEFPRLCRGGSKSLTFPEVAPHVSTDETPM